MINAILDLGCNVNIKDNQGNTAFMKMLQYNDKFPLDFEYKFMDITNSISIKDKDGKNLIHLLVNNNKLQLLRSLILSYNCIILIDGKDNNGNTPLHDACYLNLLDMIDILISAKANVNIKNKDGLYPHNMLGKKKD